MQGLNQKVLTITNFSGASTTTSYELNNLSNVDRIEVQVDWSGVTGTTINGVINILQRVDASQNYMLADSSQMTAPINITTGSALFTMWKFTANDLKIQIIKNNLTKGSLTAAIGTRV